MLFTDTQTLNKKAYEALKKIQINRKRSEPVKETSFNKNKFNVTFQEYSDDQFLLKTKFDSFVYEKLFEKLDINDRENVGKIIVEMLKDVQDIYKFINIEPKIVGFKKHKIGDSKTSLINEAESIINNFINKEYYDLSQREKEIKYKNAVLYEAKNLVIEENIKPEEAIDFAYKTILIENFLYSLNFPFIIKHKIQELFENELYNDFFDVEELRNLTESFESKSKTIAKIASILIK